MAPGFHDEYRISSSFPGCHTLITFKDDAERTVFNVDSNRKNTRNVLRHGVIVVLSTGRIVIRETLREPGESAATIASLSLPRNAFRLESIGNDTQDALGHKAFCIGLGVPRYQLSEKSVQFQLPVSCLSFPPLDFQHISSKLHEVRTIKIYFALPWQNKDFNTEKIRVILQPRQPTSVNDSETPPSTASKSLSLDHRTWSQQPPSTQSANLNASDTASVRNEDSLQILELKEQLRKQAADTAEQDKRVQELERFVQTQSHNELGYSVRGTPNVKTTDSIEQTKNPRSRKTINDSTVANEHQHAQEVLMYTDRIKELEGALTLRDQTVQELESKLAGTVARNQNLEAGFQKQVEVIAKLEEQSKLRDIPDIATLGAELAMVRGVERGDRAGTETRLQSARIGRDIVERLMLNPVFESSFLKVSEKRKMDREGPEVDKVENGEESANKRTKTGSEVTVD